jgi:hypothetical protein
MSEGQKMHLEGQHIKKNFNAHFRLIASRFGDKPSNGISTTLVSENETEL